MTYATAGLVATTPQKGFADGEVTLSFRFASTNYHGKKDDFTTNWFTVTAKGALAVNAYESISKGDRIIVFGDINVRYWDNGEQTGTSVEIEAKYMGHDLYFGTCSFTRISERPTHNCNCGNCPTNKENN